MLRLLCNNDLSQGMGLSGCEDEEANEHFVEKLLQRYDSLAKNGIAVSDTIGSIYTACPDGETRCQDFTDVII